MPECKYTQRQIGLILQKIIAKASHELQIAAEEGNVDEVMEEYGVTLEEGAMPVNRRSTKILVFGALAGNVSDYKMAAKKLGVEEKNLVFENDYHKLKHYNTATLKDSFEYSDIIYGPVPHKLENMGDSYSLLAEIEREPNRYPRLTKAVANDKLKITITNFKRAITSTRYFESIS